MYDHRFTADAAVIRSFDRQPPGSPEAAFFARLAALDASTIIPIVLLLFRSAEVTRDRRRRCLRILESWLTRRALMRLTAKNYNRLVPRLVAKLKADLEHCDEVLHEALSGGEGAISRWPDDQEFIEFVTSRDVYGTVARPRVAMALAAVEDNLRTAKTEASGSLVTEIAVAGGTAGRRLAGPGSQQLGVDGPAPRPYGRGGLALPVAT